MTQPIPASPSDDDQPQNLLVIDWDYFFFNPIEAGADLGAYNASLWDFGHSEHLRGLGDFLWTSRAAAFLAAGEPLPRVTPPEGGWAAFWDRFTFTDDVDFTYADSNMHAGQIMAHNARRAMDKIVLFDAHHDSGYGIKDIHEFLDRGQYSAEDWAIWQQLQGCSDLTVRYPQWKSQARADAEQEHLPDGVLTRITIDDGAPLGTPFTHVFACRSGMWVPPWCDDEWLAFLDAAPMSGWQVDDLPMKRAWNEEMARPLVDSILQAMQATRQLDQG